MMTSTNLATNATDAIDLAEHIVQEYAADLTGGAAEALSAVLDRLILDGPENSIDPARALSRMRGPYVQALAPPAWSESTWPIFGASVRGRFSPQGLRPELVELLTNRGFHRLYAFQEQGMRAVLDDRDALITAATGRGKTETWLIPLLQYAILAKDGELDGEPAVGTKALLLYPTKALAQDQLRRLISYLVPLNRQRPPGRRITVGIFDGDTPDGSQPGDQDYLYEAFRLFDCPVELEERCDTCPHGLVVMRKDPGNRLTLALPEPQCERRIPLDFVVLSRQDMVKESPDILITNPDMLNLRLLNVNDAGWRRLLVEQPRFLVVDEIHTYAGTFGAAVSWILRRLRLARHAANISRPLRVIAASATVANGGDLFARVAGVQPNSAEVVREEFRDFAPIPAPPAESLGPALRQRALDEMTPEAWFAEPIVATSLGGPHRPENDIETLGEILYERLGGVIEPQAGGLWLARWLHGLLRERAHTPAELLAVLADAHPQLGTDDLDVVLRNGLAVGAAAGLLESRAHLFAWPVDGFYLCTSCGVVYLEPRANCVCGRGFVTRLVACSAAADISAEGWLCPVCLRVYRLLATVDGQLVVFDPLRCSAGHDPINCVRAVWRPYTHCACGEIVRQGETCPRCSRTTSADQASDRTFEACCAQCGRSGTPGTCPCGAVIQPILGLPWACGRCGRFMEASAGEPGPCPSCGPRGEVLLGALLEVRVPNRCSVGGEIFLPGRTCGDPSHDSGPSEEQLDAYVMTDSHGRLHAPTQFRKAVPCYHPYTTYSLHGRYQTLARSPANVAVTSAQIGLRRLVGASVPPERALIGAKLLSFSDSQLDMEQLARDFNDPEVDTFVDQVVCSVLEAGARPISELVNGLREYLPVDMRSRRDWQPSITEGRILARFVRGRYRYRFGPPSLASQGLVDLFWDTVPDDLDVAAVVAELLNYNGQQRERLRRALDLSPERMSRALLTGERGGWITTNRDVVRLAVTNLSARRVGPGAPMWRSPRGRFILTALQQVAPDDRAQPFDTPLMVRAELARDMRALPMFSRAARRILSTVEPVMLRGEAYKGSTKKERRRQLEYAFAKRSSPNFLSSGPAMEVGIDIGDLDRVLLFGTPPNINAYLQRIGRAGRRSKQALVLSVSKRNPIDLYYYRDPLRLIDSRPQPVPLQEHNERTVETALTWALLDFLAGEFVVPWERSGAGPEARIECTTEPRRRQVSPAPRVTWLQVLRSRTDAVDEPILGVLDDLLRAHVEEARGYLRRLLDYGLCSRCGQRAERTEAGDICMQSDCGGRYDLAADRFASLIEGAIASFGDRMLWSTLSVRDEYRTTERRLMRRSLELDEERDLLPRGQRTEIERELRQIDARLELVRQLRRTADESDLLQNHEQSDQARFAYGIRGVEDDVAVELIRNATGEPEIERISRGIAPALREYAPGALSLNDTQEYVTLAVLPSLARTEHLRRRMEDLQLSSPRACLRCGGLTPDSVPQCANCGSATVQVDTIVPGRARAFLRDEPLRADARESARRLVPSQAFPLGDSDTPLESTFVDGGTRVLSFDTLRRVDLRDAAGKTVASLELGRIELLFTASSIAATYTTGEREGRARLFELCGESGCGGVIAPAHAGVVGFCMLDPTHDVGRRRIVQTASHFVSVGLRVRGLPILPDGHSLLHGLRAGLEKVAGVLARSIGEHVEDEFAFLFDDEPGGTGACELLLNSSEAHINLRTALEVAAGLSQCACDDGCPLCLFQYGCGKRNASATLSRRRLKVLSELWPESPASDVRDLNSNPGLDGR